MCYSPEDNAPLGAATFKHMMLREDLMGWTLADVVCSDHFNRLVTFILEEVTPPVEEQDAATAREALAALLTFCLGGQTDLYPYNQMENRRAQEDRDNWALYSMAPPCLPTPGGPYGDRLGPSQTPCQKEWPSATEALLPTYRLCRRGITGA